MCPDAAAGVKQVLGGWPNPVSRRRSSAVLFSGCEDGTDGDEQQ
jgi:hypothetical protein